VESRKCKISACLIIFGSFILRSMQAEFAHCAVVLGALVFFLFRLFDVGPDFGPPASANRFFPLLKELFL
jgi:hypothetical protein